MLRLARIVARRVPGRVIKGGVGGQGDWAGGESVGGQGGGRLKATTKTHFSECTVPWVFLITAS